MESGGAVQSTSAMCWIDFAIDSEAHEADDAANLPKQIRTF